MSLATEPLCSSAVSTINYAQICGYVGAVTRLVASRGVLSSKCRPSELTRTSEQRKMVDQMFVKFSRVSEFLRFFSANQHSTIALLLYRNHVRAAYCQLPGL